MVLLIKKVAISQPWFISTRRQVICITANTTSHRSSRILKAVQTAKWRFPQVEAPPGSSNGPVFRVDLPISKTSTSSNSSRSFRRYPSVTEGDVPARSVFGGRRERARGLSLPHPWPTLGNCGGFTALPGRSAQAVTRGRWKEPQPPGRPEAGMTLSPLSSYLVTLSSLAGGSQKNNPLPCQLVH